MVSYTNFYETIQEARMRLEETIVLYDGIPYHLLALGDHKSDGIFRAYLDPVVDDGVPYHRKINVPFNWCDEPEMSKGEKMDEWLESSNGKKSPVIRKMLNSPKFNKFRPFPLGMLNTCKGRAIYVERAPTRHTQQGLTGSSLSGITFDLLVEPGTMPKKLVSVSSCSAGLYSTIMGLYPDVDDTMSKMTDDNIANSSTAFNREFAIVRGPMDLLFLSYKGEIVGFLPYRNTNEVKISYKFSYVKEAVDELSCFNKIS